MTYRVERHDGKLWLPVAQGMTLAKANDRCVSLRLTGGNYRVVTE